MKSEAVIRKIKDHLETKGTTFTEYYGGWIYDSGPCPSEFFEFRNEGNYSVHLLVIPKEYLLSLITEDSLNRFLNLK